MNIENEQLQRVVSLLRDAESEIESLRRRNELLGAKVEVFDQLMCLLHTKPAERVQCAAPDVLYQLALERDRLERKQANI
jgi:hypothetical protein